VLIAWDWFLFQGLAIDTARIFPFLKITILCVHPDTSNLGEKEAGGVTQVI
jgi:hypothetical protein